MFSRFFRLNQSLTQYLIIFGSVVFVYSYFYYFDIRHNPTLQSSNASDNWINVDDKSINVIDDGRQIDTTNSSPTTNITENSSTSASFKSTCSAAADRRGPHQNVIGYSIYGSNFSEPEFYNLYLKSFTETLRTIPKKYPSA
jgi:hypothetical protein